MTSTWHPVAVLLMVYISTQGIEPYNAGRRHVPKSLHYKKLEQSVYPILRREPFPGFDTGFPKKSLTDAGINTLLNLDKHPAKQNLSRISQFHETIPDSAFRPAVVNITSNPTPKVSKLYNGWLKYTTTMTTTKPRTTLRMSQPTAKPRVDQSAKSEVEWDAGINMFKLKAGADYKFNIKHAPIGKLGSPWPLPQTYTSTYVTFCVNPLLFRFDIIGHQCEQLLTNIRRIRQNIFGDQSTNDVNSGDCVGNEADKRTARFPMSYLNITVLQPCTKYPHLEMDESYNLNVSREGASIVSREVWGALKGMETFSQIVYQNDHEEQFVVNETFIADFPRFRHRGVLLDTSRHYLDKQTILENLEAMAQNKFNVFHWHIVDDQSFPYQSLVFPDLSKLGAYDPETHIYTHTDIAEIIEAARLLGIRVIPEFDTPGHTFSWGFGQNHLLTPCYDHLRVTHNGLFGPMNPILAKTYRFLKDLFQEVTDVFKDKYMHIGGDEVPYDCWNSNPEIHKFMTRNQITDMHEILSMFGQKLLTILDKIGEKRSTGIATIVWQEMYENNVKLSNDTLVQVWSGDSYLMSRIAQSGLRFLYSTCWYLDWIAYGLDWDKYYRCEQLGKSQI